MYLDDWLLNPGTHQEALEQTSWLKSLCQKLGLVLNLEKSDLIPSQVSTYLGIELDTSHVRQHVSGCLPEKSGGHQIVCNERFSHRHNYVCGPRRGE